MTHDDHQPDDVDQSPGAALRECAQQADDALRRLAHLTLEGTDLTPAKVEVVLGHLADTLSALPQVAASLGPILDRSRDTHLLVTDAMTATVDTDLALDTARLYLHELRDPAIKTHRRLNATRNEAAHISATPLEDDLDVPCTEAGISLRRDAHRQPPPAGGPPRNGLAR